MEQEIIKVTRRVGTSSGVILPIKLLGATVKVTVLEEPINPLLDSIKILEKHNLSSEVLAMGLVGSYAREENEIGSDVDILVITRDTNSTIGEGKYSLTLVSKMSLEKSLEQNPVYFLPMIQEAIALINGSLFDKYKAYEIKKDNLRRLVIETKEAISKAKKMIKLDKALDHKNTGDSVGYSLVLRFRSLYIMDKIIRCQKATKREFLRMVDHSLYERYLAVKKGGLASRTPIDKAEELIKQIEKDLKDYG